MVIDLFNKKIQELTGKNFNFTNPVEVQKFLNNDLEKYINGEINLNYQGASGKFYGNIPEILEYSVLKGPIYFGKNVFIGQFSLLRGPLFIDDNVVLGAHIEVARSILLNDTKIFHKNTILDSVIGPNVTFSGFSGTCNIHPNKCIDVYYKNQLLTTSESFGATIEKNCFFSTGVMLLPGVYIKENQNFLSPVILFKNNKKRPSIYSKTNQTIE